ncbi:hypothetical protein F1559_000303 [Cyanidiococcus yangmingshanensis]|uniref:Uncharacterized protein n=1 Tax=Cyanidiococcus yangmingshanensis TaxID=2690220 RepID=A0A7J7ILM5_9RHOD|nr:hypothetical protein F1559_000303 [Cyanidiococcus yangmingshanensis]
MVQQRGEKAQTENDALLAQLLSAEEEAAEALYYANGDDWMEAFSWASPNGVASGRSRGSGRHKRGARHSGSDDDDSDEDWLESVKNQRPRSSGPARRPAATLAATAATASATSSVAATGHSTETFAEDDMKDRERKRPTAWSPDEEQRFVEALELYGRDWKRAAAHVGTRNASNFRSHAQKYFIKLYKEGRPVPPKVAETGAGHTLSGKPLDPNSAAARAYLQGSEYRKELRHRRASTGLGGAHAVADAESPTASSAANGTSFVSTGAPAPDLDEDEILRQMQLDEQLQASDEASSNESPSVDARTELTIRDPPSPMHEKPPVLEPTEYAKKRPKRSTAGRRSIHSLIQYRIGR